METMTTSLSNDPGPDDDKPHHGPDRANVVAHPPFIYLGGLILGALLDWWLPYPVLPRTLQLSVGAVLIVAGMAVAIAALARFRHAGTSVPTHTPTSAIVTGGVYGYSRNPIYIGLTLFYLGLAAVIDGVWTAAMLIPILLIMQYGVVAREEAYLERKFGDAYRAYKQSVRRWL